MFTFEALLQIVGHNNRIGVYQFMSEKLEVGSIVEGKVIRIKPFGAIVALGNQSQGLVHISQVANSFVQDINDHLTIGDMVKVKIISIDEAAHKISLSIRDALPPAPKPAYAEKPYRPREQKSNYENRSSRPPDDYRPAFSSPAGDFEDKMKDWLKQSNERQAGLNKRANKRS